MRVGVGVDVGRRALFRTTRSVTYTGMCVGKDRPSLVNEVSSVRAAKPCEEIFPDDAILHKFVDQILVVLAN